MCLLLLAASRTNGTRSHVTIGAIFPGTHSHMVVSCMPHTQPNLVYVCEQMVRAVFPTAASMVFCINLPKLTCQLASFLAAALLQLIAPLGNIPCFGRVRYACSPRCKIGLTGVFLGGCGEVIRN